MHSCMCIHVFPEQFYVPFITSTETGCTETAVAYRKFAAHSSASDSITPGIFPHFLSIPT